MEIKHSTNLAINSSRIIGKRIYLEELNDANLSQGYIDWMQDEDILQYLTGSDRGYTAQELKSYVAQMNESPANYLFGIFLNEGNVHIGNIKIGNINSLHKLGDLGLIIGKKEAWGKGYATEAVTLATQYAFNELNLNKLTAGMIVENIGSYKAFMKSGYREVGRLKRQVLLRGEYVDTVLVEKCKDRLNDEDISTGKTEELYKQAKKVIPGGTQLLSKRPEMHLPEHWPAYYREAKGCELWDLDGHHFIDMSYMGIGSCILGYDDGDVNAAVKGAIDQGVMSTLNCPEEVELAQLLCELHPWAEKVKYARSGGEAMAMAVRIARAKTNKDIVLCSGYHGWHDWYLSANLADDAALNGHLLPGLSPNGVPRGLKGTTIPFQYNDQESFLSLFEKHKGNIAAVVMEPVRYAAPEEGFLEAIREATQKENIVLVFDEITSGWRFNEGGAHLKYGINPDMAVFGKGMSNGYSMSAIIGTTPVMEAAQETFISSTYWTERIGPTAAIATINKIKACNVVDHLNKTGIRIQEAWRSSASKYGIDIEVSGAPSLCHFGFNSADALVLKTLFTQLMLERGFLATTAFYASYAHKTETVELYLNALDSVFQRLSIMIKEGNVEKHLKGPICHTGFKRLT